MSGGLAGRRAVDAQWPDLMHALGRIEAKLESLDASVGEAKRAISVTNARLDDHQSSSQRAGALMGTLAAAGIAITVELAKRGLGAP